MSATDNTAYRLISNAEDVLQSGDGYYAPGWIVPPCGMDPDIRGEDANGQPMDSVAWPVTEDPEEAIRLMDRALTAAGWRRVSDWRVDGAEWAADIERVSTWSAATPITNPDGTPLRSAWWSPAHDRWLEGETIETENMANRRAMEDAFHLRWYGESNPAAPDWRETVSRCLAALAHKRGTTVEAERKALAKKIEAKYRREIRRRADIERASK